MSRELYCTFHAADLLLGIPIDRVAEVLGDQTITPVPLAHPHVAGLLNLRGQIVTAIDARRRLGLTTRGEGTAPTVVVIRSDGELVSLLVDRPGDVVDVDDDRREQVPDTVGDGIAALTVAAHQLDRDLLLVLDPDQTLAVTS
jgi:purine-binding chemotaxis protein CheW